MARYINLLEGKPGSFIHHISSLKDSINMSLATLDVRRNP